MSRYSRCMFFKKLSALSVIAIAATTLNAIPANSASIAGTTCPKVNATKTVSNIKYTCTKSGKKLLWNKGVRVATPSIPAPTKSPKPEPSPTPTFVPPTAPTSFNDLFEYRNGISYAAWHSTSLAFNNGTSNIKSLNIYLGPQTRKPSYPTPEKALANVSQVFSTYKTPNEVIVIQYGSADIKWAEEKIKMVLGQATYDDLNSKENGHLVDSNCPNDCGGSKQVTTNEGVAIILEGVPAKINSGDVMGIARFQEGQLEAHEFFHAMQRLNGIDSKGHSFRWPAAWIVEGGAELAQNLVMSHASFEEYSKWRNADLKDVFQNSSKYVFKFLDDFLTSDPKADYWRNVDSYNSYNLGSRIMEIFVALKGPGVLLDLHASTSKYGVEEGFKRIFNIEWKEAKVEIIKVLLDQVKNKS